MITKVRLCRFKRFDDETFDLAGDSVVLAGPNNSGKTTLLHAISAWNLALRRWQVETAGKKGRVRRIGVTLDEFTALPLREMNLLWLNRHTARSIPGAKTPKAAPLYVQVFAGPQSLTIEFLYANAKLAYIRPVLSPEDPQPVPELPGFAKRTEVVHVPPFSGLGTQEPRHTAGMQNKLIGEGKAGDVIRNLVLEIWDASQKDPDQRPWKDFATNIHSLFQYELLPPEFAEARQAYIVSEYRPPGSGRQRPPALDIANAGSGFHQVLLLLAFFYARPSAVLLLDEPDAHLHFILQREIFDLIRSVAGSRNCKLVVATHSEVILNAVEPEQIISFLGHRSRRLLTSQQKRSLTEAFRTLTSLDLVQAQQVGAVLYVEDESDSKLLRAWAHVLQHDAQKFLGFPFVLPLRGKGNFGQAKGHFQCLRLAVPDIRGLCILDRDSDQGPGSGQTPEGLSVLTWRRYEAENYLINPDLLGRFVTSTSDDLFSHAKAVESRRVIDEQFSENFPSGIDWTGDSRTIRDIKGSDFLVEVLARTHRPLGKRDLFMLAEMQERREIHSDILGALNTIAGLLPAVVPAVAANESATDDGGVDSPGDEPLNDPD
jgi:predicted ATPase